MCVHLNVTQIYRVAVLVPVSSLATRPLCGFVGGCGMSQFCTQRGPGDLPTPSLPQALSPHSRGLRPPEERAASESDLAQQFRLADAELPFPEEVLRPAKLCGWEMGLGWGREGASQEGQLARPAAWGDSSTNFRALSRALGPGRGEAGCPRGQGLLFRSLQALRESSFAGTDSA